MQVPYGRACWLHELASSFLVPDVYETWLHTLAPQVLVALGTLVRSLAQVPAKGRVLGRTVEIVVTVTRTTAERRAGKGPADEARAKACKVAGTLQVAFPVRIGAAYRA